MSNFNKKKILESCDDFASLTNTESKVEDVITDRRSFRKMVLYALAIIISYISYEVKKEK